jgi:hypothetical protein
MNKTTSIVLFIAAVFMLAARSHAQAEPLQMTGMQVTDLSVAPAFISWTTDQQTTGNKIEVTLQDSILPDSTWQVDDSYAGASYVHYVQILGLTPSTEYTFRVISADTQWDSDGEGYTFSTLGYAPPGVSSIALFNTVTDSWGNPAKRCLVRYWIYNVEQGASLPRTVFTDSGGEWAGNIGTMFNSSGTNRFFTNGDDLLFLEFMPNYWTSIRDSVDMPTSTTIFDTRAIQVIDPNASEPGDVDGNGKLNIFDVLDILKVIGGKVIPDPRMGAASDVDANGKVDIFDLLALLKKLRPAATASS